MLILLMKTYKFWQKWTLRHKNFNLDMTIFVLKNLINSNCSQNI